MKPVHERSQECLPPKKRDLPVTSEDMGRTTSCSTNHTPSSDASEWSQGVVVAGQSQAGARVSLGGDGAEAITGLTVDQYEMLYKVAVPPATFSSTGLPFVVNMSPLPPTKKKKRKRKKSKRIYRTSQNIRIINVLLESLLSESFPLLGVTVHPTFLRCTPTLC